MDEASTKLESDVAERLEWARTIAREAGEVTLKHYRSSDLTVDRKGDDSPVTVADRGAEELLRARIAERFSGDGIVGEEFGRTAGESGWTWVLDPIDGTKSFIHGVPLYTTLVAVMRTPDGVPENGTPTIGIIRAPALDEEIFAATGTGAWYSDKGSEPRRASVSKCDSLTDGLLLTSEVASFGKSREPDALDVFLSLQSKVRLARTWGDAYGYMMVAIGRAEVMIDPAMSLWDAAALQPVIEEAGGKFTDWQGTPTVHTGDAVAGPASIVDQVLTVTRGR